MATSRDDIADATGHRTFMNGRGTTRGFPSGNTGEYTAGTGVPLNGAVGFAPGATWQNVLGSAGSAFYVNVGTATSATWYELTGGSGGTQITMAANTADAFDFTDGTTQLLTFDTRNTVSAVKANLFSASPATITAAAGTTHSQVATSAETLTLTGSTGVTALDGLGLYLDVPTVTDASAVTVTTLSTLFVALPVAGGSVTGTNIYAANFAGQIRVAGNVNMAAAASDIVIPANTAAALEVSDGTTKIMAFDTRNTVTGANAVTLTPSPATITSATAALRASTLVTAAKTVTFTGTTATTSMLGAGAFFDTPTFTDASVMTITTVSNVHIAQVAAAGGSLTITNSRMISTGVADCFLTNAGVWTDTASTRDGKEDIAAAEPGFITRILDAITPRTWKYREDVHGDDLGRQRVGIVIDELPGELQAPGVTSGGVAAGVLGSFAMAALKFLRDENSELKRRLARLEAMVG